MKIEIAEEKNIDTLVQLRIDYLRIDKGFLSEEDEKTIRNQTKYYLKKHIPLQDFIAVVAKEKGKILSTAFLIIQERPANLSFISGITGTLLNVITYPEFRKKGIATQLIQFLINEAKKRGISSMDLFATEDGKSLYAKLGFNEPPYTAMRLKL